MLTIFVRNEQYIGNRICTNDKEYTDKLTVLLKIDVYQKFLCKWHKHFILLI